MKQLCYIHIFIGTYCGPVKIYFSQYNNNKLSINELIEIIATHKTYCPITRKPYLSL